MYSAVYAWLPHSLICCMKVIQAWNKRWQHFNLPYYFWMNYFFEVLTSHAQYKHQMLRFHSTFLSMISTARCFACWKLRRPSGICTSSLRSPIWKWMCMGPAMVDSGPIDSWEKEPERKRGGHLRSNAVPSDVHSFRLTCTRLDVFLNCLVIAKLFYSVSLMVKNKSIIRKSLRSSEGKGRLLQG